MDALDSDIALLRRYVDARDAEAFADLVRRYSSLVYNTARRVTGCSTDAEDVVQECFLDLARQAAGIRSILPAWLHCVATRRALNLRSARMARRARESSGQPTVASPTVSGEWSELAPLLDQAILDLPEDLRAPLLLAFFDNVSHDDIATRLGCSRATVGRRIDEAIVRLRRRLERAHGSALAVALPAMLLTLPRDQAPLTAVHGAIRIGLAGYGPAAVTGRPWWWIAASVVTGVTGVLVALVFVLPFSNPPGSGAIALPAASTGLQASLFNNVDLAGTPLRRIDPTIDFDWAGRPPAVGMSGEQFSIRWSARLAVPRNGDYTFTVTSDDGVWLMLDGTVLIDEWSGHFAQDRSVTVTLDADRPHELVLDYFQSLLNASVKLAWSGPGIPLQVVPATQFQPLDLPTDWAGHRLVLPGTWSRIAIGRPPPRGSIHADANGQEFSLASAEGDLGGGADRCQFTAREVGDEALITRVTWMYPPDRRVFAGIMVRASAEPDAAMLACGMIPGDGLVVLARDVASGQMRQLASLSIAASPWLRVTRLGDLCTAAYSDDGVTWQVLASQALPLHPRALLGLTLAGGRPDEGAGAVFRCADLDPHPAEPIIPGDF